MSKPSKNMGYLKKHKLHIPFQEISSATDEFNEKNIIGKGGYGNVFEGISEKHGRIAVKRLNPSCGQGDHEFKMEINLLSKYKHKNIASLLGFCVDHGEKILVYKFESKGSLDKHLKDQDLTWIQRLQICHGAACGLAHLHDSNPGFQSGVYHRDVKSSNILLDDKWTPKISDFGLSRVGSKASFVISNPCGTPGYLDPYYENVGYLTKKTDVYSFGVVLWELVCGRSAQHASFTNLVKVHYQRKSLDKIIPPYLYKQIVPVSLVTFAEIANQCLKDLEERPTMKDVMEQLQLALQNQQVVVSQEVTMPKEEEGKKAKAQAEEALKHPNEGKKDDLPPALSPSQEVVLKVLVHCEGCADKLKKCLKKVTGVERVIAKCGTDKVIVKGSIANPLELAETVHKKFKWDVEVIPPPTYEPEKSRTMMIEKSKQQEPDNEPVSVITKQCESCAEDAKKSIIKTKVPDLHISQVEVIGTGDEKTGNQTVIVNQDPTRTLGKKTETSGDDNPTISQGADPHPLEENQWLLVLEIFGLFLFITCKLVSWSIVSVGQRVHRMLLQIYDIPDPQLDDLPLPQDSPINEQSPQQSLP
ncbi:hypothetical protein R6Q59_012071 [Mikania micrantha]